MNIRRCTNCGHPSTSHSYSYDFHGDLECCQRYGCDCIALDGEYGYEEVT